MEIIEFHSTFSRHGNAQASLTLLIWLNEKVQKLGLKNIQKLMLVRRTAHLFSWESPNGEKSYRIDSKSNRILGLYAGRHTDVGALRAEIIQN